MTTIQYISQLGAAATGAATDLIPVTQGSTGPGTGTTRKMTPAQLSVTATGSTTSRTLANRFADAVNAKDFGAVGDGVTDDRAAIQAAINAAAVAALTRSGVEVQFDANIYALGGSLDLLAKHGVELVGRGKQATELRATGDFPAIKCDGTSANVTNCIAVKNIQIRGGGNTLANAHGIRWVFVNRGELENIRFFGCMNAMDLAHQWQTKITNCHAFGGGTDRSNTFLYMQPSTLAYIDNAVIATGCVGSDTLSHGYRIINGQGSKFVSCEAGGNGGNSWYIGDPPAGTVLCQWLHFANCLADSVPGHGWLFRRGAATTMGEIVMTGTWSGNTGLTGDGTGLRIEGGTDFDIAGLMTITTSNAVMIQNSTRIALTGLTSRQYNGANNNSACVQVDNSSACSVGIGTAQTTNAADTIREVNASDGNTYTGVGGVIVLIGLGSQYYGSTSTYSFLAASAGNTASAIVAPDANTAYLGFGTHANPLRDNLQRTSGGRLLFVANSGTRMTIGNGVGATDFRVWTDVPFAPYVGTVAQVAGLTALAGSLAFATNGRKNGEGVGAGTGVLAFGDGTAWRACDTGVTLAS